MADKKKVYVVRDGVYIPSKDNKTVELPKGEQSIDAKIADSLIKRGVVLDGDPNAKKEKELVNNDGDPELSAKEIVELIESAESIEDIEEYQDDKRKTVKAAFEAKLEQLAEDDSE